MNSDKGTAVFALAGGDGRVSPARFVASPNCDARPDAAVIEVLVIHAISLPPGCYGGRFIEDLFTNKLDTGAHPYFAKLVGVRVSAHFLVKRDGELLQFVPLHRRAWHAGESHFRGRAGVNDFSVGIELEGCDADSFTDAQYERLAGLIRFLRMCCPAVAADNVTGHSDIAPDRKTDPGPGFDWARLEGEAGVQRNRR